MYLYHGKWKRPIEPHKQWINRYPILPSLTLNLVKRGQAIKNSTMVQIFKRGSQEVCLIEVLKNPMEGYLLSSAEDNGVLYTLARLTGIGIALITTCVGTGTRHKIFLPPEIPRQALQLAKTHSGVAVVDQNKRAWFLVK